MTTEACREPPLPVVDMAMRGSMASLGVGGHASLQLDCYAALLRVGERAGCLTGEGAVPTSHQLSR